MKQKKIFILLANPDKETFSGALSDAYEEGVKSAGHEVRRLNLGDLDFDPILHKGYKVIQKLEPDLVAIQENISWAEHFVVIYPNWWNTMPALLKGMFDRMWLPGFAFNFDKQEKNLIQRLSGKSARVIIVAGTYSSFITRLKFGDFKNEIKRGILEFSGISPVLITYFGPVDYSTQTQREQWKKQVFELGKRGV